MYIVFSPQNLYMFGVYLSNKLYSTYIETWAGVVEQIDLLYWIQLSSIVALQENNDALLV